MAIIRDYNLKVYKIGTLEETMGRIKTRGLQKKEGVSALDIFDFLKKNNVCFEPLKNFEYKNFREEILSDENYIDVGFVVDCLYKEKIGKIFCPIMTSSNRDYYKALFNILSLKDFATISIKKEDNGLIRLTDKGELLQKTHIFYQKVKGYRWENE